MGTTRREEVTPTTYLSRTLLKSFENQTNSSTKKKTRDFIAKLNREPHPDHPLPFDEVLAGLNDSSIYTNNSQREGAPDTPHK